MKQILAEDQDLLKTLVTETLQQTLEAEMDEALATEKSERTTSRLGYRSGYYPRRLVTRVGKIELRVPQDRGGHRDREGVAWLFVGHGDDALRAYEPGCKDAGRADAGRELCQNCVTCENGVKTLL